MLHSKARDRNEQSTQNDPAPGVLNPFYQKLRSYRDAVHDLLLFKQYAPEIIADVTKNLINFTELSRNCGFYVLNDHEQTVQVSFGHRLMARKTFDGKNATENGASLVYSQGPTGDIVAILYPARSDVARVNETLIFLRQQQRSGRILLNGLRRDLKDLIAYELVTSLDGCPNFRDKIRVSWLRFVKTRQRDHNFNEPENCRSLSEVTNAMSSKAASSTVVVLVRLFIPIIAVVALTHFGLTGLAGRIRPENCVTRASATAPAAAQTKSLNGMANIGCEADKPTCLGPAHIQHGNAN